MSPASRLRIASLVLATVAALTPLAWKGGHVMADAECPTCCPQSGPKCVVCSTTCVVIDNAYDAGPDKCPVSQT
jgi:hypothetical protein